MSERLQPIVITAATTLSKKTHGETTVVQNSATAMAITLPASSGDGTKFRIVVHTTVTGSLTIVVANSTDVMRGGVAVSTDVAGITMLATGTDDTITMNGSTSGGLNGSTVELTDYLTGFWNVTGFLVSSGSEATPFSATIS